jgi:hypothetical protein
MRKRTIGLAVATLATAATLVPAATAGQTYDTTIVVEDAELASNDRVILSGLLEANRKDCRANRYLKLLIRSNPGGVFNLVDNDRSSTQGVWAMSLEDDQPIDATRVKVTRKRLGPNKTCSPDSVNVQF